MTLHSALNRLCPKVSVIFAPKNTDRAPEVTLQQGATEHFVRGVSDSNKPYKSPGIKILKGITRSPVSTNTSLPLVNCKIRGVGQ